MDSNGRILLPVALREFARMDKKIVLIGQGKRFELWDETTWQSSRELWLAAGVNEAETLPAELDSLSL
jgi:MraZ protein